MVNILGAVAATVPAPAEPPPFERLVFDAALGAGYSSGTHTFEGTSQPPWTGSQYRFEPRVTGTAILLDVTAAAAVAPSAAFGVALGFTTPPSPSLSEEIPYTTVDGVGAVSLSLVGIYRPFPAGFEGALGLGLQTAAFYGAQDDVGAADNVYEMESQAGPRLAVRVGYVSAIGLGGAVTGSYAWLSGSNSRYTPLTWLLQATFTTR